MEKNGETSTVQDTGGGGEKVLPEGPALEKEEPRDQSKAEKEGPPGESPEVKDHQGKPKDDQQKPLHIQHSFSCPAQVSSLGDIPEEASEAPSPPSPPDPAAASPPAPEPSERTLPKEPLSPISDADGASLSPGSKDTTSSEEPGCSPYLTPDFGKEDPSLILDDTPPPPAPFTHRIVTLRTGDFKDTYKLNTKEILGG
ncbi:myosin light chain kinase 2, skeletal/cardiac muscle-like, partial [Notechis scutatus]|uniref:Myosin light chain kinase 2, skeletal/cardiac muscle-like n=1 Tax=Notechis scutatus TaxID=8663 RepID=A0A6J1VYF8_9SAUR